ncbi:hypothetical protein ACIGXA_11410 [Streptomyces fildesensis]|uniref:Uncharacterized protein n=1 Tax=Streptomyces fildesensis TaxID=375757 RepID=A0ABW8C3W8_9ACTN
MRTKIYHVPGGNITTDAKKNDRAGLPVWNTLASYIADDLLVLDPSWASKQEEDPGEFAAILRQCRRILIECFDELARQGLLDRPQEGDEADEKTREVIDNGVRSMSEDLGSLGGWQELVDAVVVAGDIDLAPYSE